MALYDDRGYQIGFDEYNSMYGLNANDPFFYKESLDWNQFATISDYERGIADRQSFIDKIPVFISEMDVQERLIRQTEISGAGGDFIAGTSQARRQLSELQQALGENRTIMEQTAIQQAQTRELEAETARLAEEARQDEIRRAEEEAQRVAEEQARQQENERIKIETQPIQQSAEGLVVEQTTQSSSSSSEYYDSTATSKTGATTVSVGTSSGLGFDV